MSNAGSVAPKKRVDVSCKPAVGNAKARADRWLAAALIMVLGTACSAGRGGDDGKSTTSSGGSASASSGTTSASSSGEGAVSSSSTGGGAPTGGSASSGPASSSSTGSSSSSSGGAAGGYTYHGVSIYPPNDWFTTDLTKPSSNYVTTTVDPDSSTIVDYLASIYGDIAWYAPPSETVNLATNATPKHTVSGCSYGCDDDPWNDDPNPFQIPVTSPLAEEGSSDGSKCIGGDCHVIVLNVDDHLAYETYTSGKKSWDGTTYSAEAAAVHNLDHPYEDQMHMSGGTAGSTPLLGTTNWGEDASLPAIPHIVGFQMPVGGRAMSGHVPPANGNATCTSDCTATLPYGARLRLKPSFTCPPASTYPQANLVCVQLKTYGMIFDDVNTNGCQSNGVGAGYCVYGLRFGNKTDGTSPWKGDGCCGNSPTAELDQLFMPAGKYYLHITDFEVMTLGPIQH